MRLSFTLFCPSPQEPVLSLQPPPAASTRTSDVGIAHPAPLQSQDRWVADPLLDGDDTIHRDRSSRRGGDLSAHSAIAKPATQEQKAQDDEKGRR
jgi:hypothetical protein